MTKVNKIWICYGDNIDTYIHLLFIVQVVLKAEAGVKRSHGLPIFGAPLKNLVAVTYCLLAQLDIDQFQ